MIAMIRAIALAALPLLLTAAAPPKLRLSEVQQIVPEGYRAELTLDSDQLQFSGEIQIRIRVNQPAQTIWLNASQITVQNAEVTVSGRTLSGKSQVQGDDFLALEFESPIPAGTAVIRIRYSGKIRRPDTSGIFQVEDGGNHYLLTQFEETDARDAFPCFDEPNYKVPWQLTLRIPASQNAISNTPPSSETMEEGHRKIVFQETKPLPSYLIAFAVGPWEFVDGGVAGRNKVPVRIVTPKGRAAEAKYAAEVTATILTRLEEYFGIPYPYEKADQVSVPVSGGFGAMENAGMVTYGQTILLSAPESDTVSRQRGYAAVAAHELAHQWFGDLVTTGWWDDIWLNEAFATWMEQKLIAEWKPEWNTRVSDVASKLGAAEQDSLASARKIRQEIESKDDISNAFDGITYEKGASVIAMFESWMGEAEFRKGVQGYVRQYANRNATSGEFLDSLSSVSRKDVTRAFSTFLNQPGIPIVSVTLDCTGKTPSLHLEQSRYAPIGSKAPVNQTWNVPVCVRFGDGNNDRACTLMTQAQMDLPLSAKTCPAWVQANDNAKGYYRVDYQGRLLSSLIAGDVTRRINAAERADLIGNAQALASGGRLPIADALKLAETFRNDPARQVVNWGVAVALSIDRDLVPDDLRPNYQRFLQKSYGARAHELGWIGHDGESDDVRLLRPLLLSAVAGPGGDRELARQAGDLALKWLEDRKAVPPDIVGAVLSVAARYGDVALYRKFMAEFQKTRNRQEQQQLVGAMTAFRDPAALQIGMEDVASGRVPLSSGLPLLSAGQGAPATRHLAFQFLKQHFNEIMKDNPSIFGTSLGASLPNVGVGSCDPESRKELADYFTPLVSKYEGAPRNLAHVLETIDLCVARVNAQRQGVADFLKKY